LYGGKLSPIKSNPKEENLKDAVKNATYNHPDVADGEGKDADDTSHDAVLSFILQRGPIRTQYYEELTEALFRCLELNERAIILESDAKGESAEAA
jgi:hypothetical protein